MAKVSAAGASAGGTTEAGAGRQALRMLRRRARVRVLPVPQERRRARQRRVRLAGGGTGAVAGTTPQTLANNERERTRMDTEIHAKVLVVGSGIAGTCAALSAAEVLDKNGNKAAVNCSEGASAAGATPVMLACKGPLFSGSSFFEGTWGLGLIAPDGADDEEDLVQTILRVGCGAANEDMVRSFVTGILPAIKRLESWGVTLKQATQGASEQREYIPCFDHKHRAWRGIEREPYVTALGQRIASAGICVNEGWELLDIDPESHLATFFATPSTPSSTATPAASNLLTNYPTFCQQFVRVRYDALVLCTGGASSLYSRHLTQDDCCATVQGLAEQVGCHLTNMAFLQFMPGIVSPVQGIVFNEKTFRYMALDNATVEELGGTQEVQRLLDMRSGYGPFTSRLDSCAIDFAIHRAGKDGLVFTPHFGNEDELPEFVRTYQTWLETVAGVTAETPLRVAMYAHANNGGLVIDQHGCTTVSGIFAAGECTGGMHGADRLGGLSSANGLVFGMRAGESAAKFALAEGAADAPGATGEEAASAATATTAADHAAAAAPSPKAALPTWMHLASTQTERIEEALSNIMDESYGIVREKAQVEHALQEIDALSEQLTSSSTESSDAAAIAATRTTQLRLATARTMVIDILRQPKSRGSHCWSA